MYFFNGHNPMNNEDSKKCFIYAHRGARTEAADNTRLAFDKALNYSIDGIETDVQLTKDEVSVLWHDRFLDKLGFPEKHIDDFTFEQLKQMNFACYSSDSEIEGVLTLQEFVKTYRSQCRLQIEIKNRDWEDTIRHQIKMQQCLEIVGSSENCDVFISSFNLHCLEYANQLGTSIPLVHAFEVYHSYKDVVATVHRHQFLSGLCHPISTLNESIVQLLHNHNKLIVTYTCNTAEEIQKALDLGVDILISDKPQKAISMRG